MSTATERSLRIQRAKLRLENMDLKKLIDDLTSEAAERILKLKNLEYLNQNSKLLIKEQHTMIQIVEDCFKDMLEKLKG